MFLEDEVASAQDLRANMSLLDHCLPDAPENLQWVVSKLMAREREDRFGAAQEAYDELVGLKQSILSA